MNLRLVTPQLDCSHLGTWQQIPDSHTSLYRFPGSLSVSAGSQLLPLVPQRISNTEAISDTKTSLETVISSEEKYFWENTQTCGHLQGDFLGAECRNEDSVKQGLHYQAEMELNVVIERSQARLEVGTDDKNWKNQKMTFKMGRHNSFLLLFKRTNQYHFHSWHFTGGS